MKLKQSLSQNRTNRMAIFAFALLIAATANAEEGVIYQTGFEPPTYSPGTIDGQDGWFVNGTSTTRTVVQTSAFISGLQAICITSSADGGNAGAVRGASYNAANQILTFDIDMFLSATGTPNFWTAIDAQFFPPYSSYNNIDINIDNNGRIHCFIMGTDHPSGAYVARGLWNHYALEVDFIDNTVSAFYNTTPIVQNVSFSPHSTTLGLYAFYPQAIAATDYGYFDNFSLTSRIPEPATLLLLGLGAAFVRKRKA